MRLRLTIAVTMVATALSLGEPAAGMKLDTPTAPFDDNAHECLEAVPESVSAVGITDDGAEVTVETLVLLDGISKGLGRKTMRLANESYTPLEIELAPSYRTVRLEDDGAEAGMDDEVGPTGDMNRMIDQAQAMFEGTRPDGIDVVLTLTNKDLFIMDGGQRSYGVAGMADCIGGVRYDEHSFAVSEAVTPYTEILGDEFPAMAAAHEVGHLLGAHHHYGNCAEGDESGKPCTIMWPALIEYASRNFGTLESVTVRGHAVDFAS